MFAVEARLGLADCLATVASMIEDARERLRRGIRQLAQSHAHLPFDPQTIEEILAANLAGELLPMMDRVMVLELNVARLEGHLSGYTSEERFQSFLQRLQQPDVAEQILRDYPLLGNQIANRLDKWCAFRLEFLKHLCEDWNSLQESFFSVHPGMLVMVQGGAGDTHRDGRSVIIASFSNGARIVYKPRSLAVDDHFQQLLAWLNGCGAQPHFRMLQVLDRGHHGWTEFVAAAPCDSVEEVARFYQRQGSYLAVLYALEASDFHCENLIAAGEHPVLIDLEALFHPRIDDSASDRADLKAGAALGYSALRVGLLPLRLFGSGDEPGVDMSGLGSAAGQLSPSGVPQWEQAGTDEMHLVRTRVEIPGSTNRPSLDGREASALDHAEFITAGFASTYRLLLEHRDALLTVLNRFSQDEVRVIARATQTYATLLRESFHPDLLHHASERTKHFDRLEESVVNRPGLSKLLAAERADLLNGDVPLFTTRPSSRHLWTSRNQRLDEFFTDSGEALVKRRVLQLSEQDLERQLWIVRASLATLSSHNAGPLTKPRQESSAARLTRQQLLSAACGIGDRLKELAITGDGDATWLGLVPLDEREWTLSPLGLDLYDGLPGVALFLARLGAVSENSLYSNLAKSALISVRRQLQESGGLPMPGAFNGSAGIIYTLCHLGAIWNDPSLFAEAEALLDPIAKMIEQDQVLDIIGGSAGCVLALRSLDRYRPSTKLIEISRACGETLLRSSQPLLTGYAHGNAGIAHALLELAAFTRDSRFEHAASKAFDYERSLFSPEQRNWPDLRTNAAGGFAVAWCHGAPGIGLSRMHALRYLEDPLLSGEIEAALATTLAQGFGSNHSLCHGDLGNADVLLEASEILHDQRWLEHAHRVAAAAVNSARQTGWTCGNPLGVESPGLMTGLAGIGYTLLRLADPAGIPSILTLDPGRTR